MHSRQLHPDEKQTIRNQTNGNVAIEQKLTQASCYVVHCWAQYSPNSDAYVANYVSPRQSACDVR